MCRWFYRSGSAHPLILIANSSPECRYNMLFPRTKSCLLAYSGETKASKHLQLFARMATSNRWKVFAKLHDKSLLLFPRTKSYRNCWRILAIRKLLSTCNFLREWLPLIVGKYLRSCMTNPCKAYAYDWAGTFLGTLPHT
jgi:hypothetical protein